MSSPAFNLRLRAARKAAGLTQAQVRARLVHVPRRTLEDWEAGRRVPNQFTQSFLLASLCRMARKPCAIFRGHEFTAKGSTLKVRRIQIDKGN